jgi:hypothetical protein
MIRYALKCANGHGFESWFQSSAAFDSLQAAGQLTCAICGNGGIEKAVMSPAVTTAESVAATQANAVAVTGPRRPGPEEMLAELRRRIEATAEDVGRRFAAEARLIHEGEAPNRPIYGEASLGEARALLEDGIRIAPLPWIPRSRTN